MSAQPSAQLSQIEKSVTHLLIATKQLLETLTQWSRHTASESDVSDVYVRLGYEFNIACRAFTTIGVETADLGPVPELLRAILEETLSQEASPASLDRYLPRIRDIIITLLHGLKRKQQRLRSKQNKDGSPAQSYPSGDSDAGSTVGQTQEPDDHRSRRTGSRGSERRIGSDNTFNAALSGERSYTDELGTDPRYAATHPNRADSGARGMETGTPIELFDSQRTAMATSSDAPMANVPHIASMVAPQSDQHPSAPHHDIPFSHPPPPPPPKQQDALAALQRGGDLERRASRRYSAYQISKHLGASPNGVPMLPTQNSPIPNRGKDVRESMNAVRVRGSGLHSRQRSANDQRERSPAKGKSYAQRISEESYHSQEFQGSEPATELQGQDLSTGSSVNEGRQRLEDNGQPHISATMAGPPPDVVNGIPPYDMMEGHEEGSVPRPMPGAPLRKGSHRSLVESRRLGSSSPAQSSQFVPDQSPQPGKELTLFLQYKSKIKKFVLPEGLNELSVARLQLAFIEKFAWNTHSNGNDLPEIYIQDPVSGVRHELEDLSDVKDRCVLVLNIEVLDEVKKHIDEGLGGIRKLVEGVRTAMDSQQLAVRQVSEQQKEANKDIARLSTTPKVANSEFSSGKPRVNGISRSAHANAPKDHLANVQSLRQDLAVVRQSFSSFVSDVKTSMADVHNKASSVRSLTLNHGLEGLNASNGRSYVESGKKVLSEDSERIVTRVDDLQDIVEDLRKDVVTRGVRPLPRQLDDVGKNISLATTELKKMQEYLKREKPVWTKIWEQELQAVCQDREDMSMQEDLVADLEDDLEKAAQTFALVEQATKQQNVQAGNQPGVGVLKPSNRGLNPIMLDTDVDPQKAKDGVLGEVRALRPNHENRLEAIERAEKARQRELEDRREGAFKKELGKFVDEGKLKKSGGVEEAERQRKVKDDRIRKEAWEKQQQRSQSKGKTGEAIEPEMAKEGSIHSSKTTSLETTPTEGTSAESEALDSGLPQSQTSPSKGMF